MSTFFLVLLSFIFAAINISNAGRGGGYAAPFVYGPISNSDTAVFGSPGLRMCYSITPQNNLSPLVCCQARGYNSNMAETWYDIFCGYDSISGCVNWGNVLSYPAVKCKGNPTGTMYQWTH